MEYVYYVLKCEDHIWRIIPRIVVNSLVSKSPKWGCPIYNYGYSKPQKIWYNVGYLTPKKQWHISIFTQKMLR